MNGAIAETVLSEQGAANMMTSYIKTPFSAALILANFIQVGCSSHTWYPSGLRWENFS